MMQFGIRTGEQLPQWFDHLRANDSHRGVFFCGIDRFQVSINHNYESGNLRRMSIACIIPKKLRPSSLMKESYFL